MGRLSPRARPLPHAGAAALYLAVALLWTYPLAAAFTTHIPGAPGDNLTFLWNFWWMRAALDGGSAVFFTTALFAPWGVDLALHTHTALPALAGATVLGALPLPAALNTTVIGGVALSGFCAYWLAWRATGDRPAALLGGIIFGCSPFIASRLNGHFNLIHAWTLPLFALAVIEYLDARRRGWAVAAGLTLGATAYIDYYFVVYQLVLLALLVAWEARRWTLNRVRPSHRVRLVTRAMLAAALMAFASAAAIALSGGIRFDVGGVPVSVRSVFNPLQIAWLLLLLSALLVLVPRIRGHTRAAYGAKEIGEPFLLIGVIFLLTAAPLLWRGLVALAVGDYVSQPVLWRSSPRGIDVATLVAGNPFHGLWGQGIAAFLQRCDIDVIESSGWIGVVPLGLAWIALRRHARLDVVKRWLVVGGAFLLWSLGPHLTVLGHNVGLALPHAAVRYLPIVSNARMPGRAMVVVYLALAILAAIAAARLGGTDGRRRWLVALLGAGVLVDYLPMPLPLTALDRPALYGAHMAQGRPGSVLELPLGLRDGFGVVGSFDERILWYQTLHGRPLAGGFVARLPPSSRSAYESDALFAALLGLSAGNASPELPAPEEAAALLRQHGFAFVVLDRRAAPVPLVRYVDTVLRLEPVATVSGRSLFAVPGP
jgi:hypothetical protein